MGRWRDLHSYGCYRCGGSYDSGEEVSCDERGHGCDYSVCKACSLLSDAWKKDKSGHKWCSDACKYMPVKHASRNMEIFTGIGPVTWKTRTNWVSPVNTLFTCQTQKRPDKRGQRRKRRRKHHHRWCLTIGANPRNCEESDSRHERQVYLPTLKGGFGDGGNFDSPLEKRRREVYTVARTS